MTSRKYIVIIQYMIQTCLWQKLFTKTHCTVVTVNHSHDEGCRCSPADGCRSCLHGDLNRLLSRAALLNAFDQCWRCIYLLSEEVTEECEVGGEPEISWELLRTAAGLHLSLIVSHLNCAASRKPVFLQTTIITNMMWNKQSKSIKSHLNLNERLSVIL